MLCSHYGDMANVQYFLLLSGVKMIIIAITILFETVGDSALGSGSCFLSFDDLDTFKSPCS